MFDRRSGALLLTLIAAGAHATELIALTDRGTLIAFPSDRPAEAHTLTMAACPGQLLGIDRRPADQKIYGLTDTNDIVRLDLDAHTCSRVSTLTIPFSGGNRGGLDFTPQLDRLRCVSADGQNLRIHPTLGATALDTALAYASDDPQVGRRPEITAAGYTHNVANTPTTTLYEIDAAADTLVIQDPANEGTLRTVGPLGVDAGTAAGFEIVTDPDGTEHPWLALGHTLYGVDLTNGHATPIGQIGSEEIAVVSLASRAP